jgi:hypothetical protein
MNTDIFQEILRPVGNFLPIFSLITVVYYTGYRFPLT